MNIDNINIAIRIMQRVKDLELPLDMGVWQAHRPKGYLCKTVEELHYCGTAACFAGHVAVSPEWPGGVALSGAPELNGIFGTDAIAKWLDIGHKNSCLLCMMEILSCGTIYGSNPTPDDVIGHLEVLKSGGDLRT